MHITNVGADKSWYIKKGDIMAFARPESEAVQYIDVLGPECKIKQNLQVRPRNWISESASVPPIEVQETFMNIEDTIKGEHNLLNLVNLQTKRKTVEESNENLLKSLKINVEKKETTRQYGEVSENYVANRHKNEENSRESLRKKKRAEDKWANIQEIVESNFLTSPADIYLNRRVELEDAEISGKTKEQFAQLYNEYDDVFSKNNQDIGKTTLIEMEIDTEDSLPVAQSLYTLPLKHFEWVRKEIETLEKAGVIVKSLSPWASPVIVVPKKSAPDEPPRRRLVIDYRKINSLQQQIKRADKSTGCLSLYPLPKIDEMFAKLNGSRILSTINLRSGYYHIGLTEGSRPKSAFVVPMGKFEFLRTPFGLSQVPAYFQLLIDNILQGCSKFAKGYLDDIIIFSNTEEEHLEHLERIFKKLREYGLKMKREKCDFFKKHLQYLGHLILEEGFEPLPEKIKSIKNMPPLKTAKEVKQFLGLAGYSGGLVPRFADLSRPLTNLTRVDYLEEVN